MTGQRGPLSPLASSTGLAVCVKSPTESSPEQSASLTGMYARQLIESL
jgi:hypothetical protein